MGNERMKLNKCRFIILCICLFGLVGCQSERSLMPRTFEEIYPANLSDVTEIEIRHGNGELKKFTDKEMIDDWLESLKDITFEPADKQEGSVGYLYSVKIFEGNEVKIFFDTSKIDDFYYIPNNQVVELIEELFVES
ncbi:hypothetical protein [Sporosarcina sp. NPDC096371]|uniref:hypothetical protein n=1 Tax=Sporosarcina sp. NPDC096371 TaxID=3364530 RepID=UPI0038047E05